MGWSTKSGASPVGPSGVAGKEKEKGKVTAGGAGTSALTGGKVISDAGALSNIGAGPAGTNALGTPTGDPSKAIRGERGPGGGTTTQSAYTPGALGNFPNADIPTVVEKIVGPLVPGVGGMLGIAGAKQAIEDPSKTTTVLGGDPGPQRGWQPDRYRGSASLGGIGGSGGAVNSGEREIAGRPIGAAARIRQDNSVNDGDDLGVGGATDQYSEVMMKDRRKPGLKQMLETML
ncbi:hypothetical protein [Dongia sedimenti]|uniref:Uncharacterized protein n=1 Tax=Dongia sedimenti TaxID=3064282 RepID=A0ABU0YG90_9PROT|nr:hypothetical protein [Rhodospirillaceae bacterium R-7]